MKIAAVQLTPSVEPSENFDKMRHFAGLAAAQGADVIVFPEQTMALLSAVTPESLTKIAAEYWEAFTKLTAELAAQHGAVIVTAGFEPGGSTAPTGSESTVTALPFNTMIAIAPDGVELARYRKLHLYEAFAASESAHTQRGADLPPVFHVERGEEQISFGLANCYDVRFPEMFRSLVDRAQTLSFSQRHGLLGPAKKRTGRCSPKLVRSKTSAGWWRARLSVAGHEIPQRRG